MAATLERNIEHNGLELTFDRRPDQEIINEMKSMGFRWHGQKKLWFAKETPERLELARRLAKVPEMELSPAPAVAEKAVTQGRGEGSKQDKAPNTFAAHYDAIGDAKILSDSNVSIMSYTQAYLQDIKCHYRRTYGGDSVVLTDLTDAGKVGKTCRSWHIYPKAYGENVVERLLNDEQLQTCKDLFSALKEGRDLEFVSVSAQDEKAVEIFSPFEEVKPLKSIPERWNKRNFAIAALSGQIYRGEVAYRYTDDYAMDAAYRFGEGASLSMPSFVRNVVEDWGQLTSVSARKDESAKDGTQVLSYSEHSNSCKTLWFDLNCDIAEGKRRAEVRQAGLDRYNKMMEASCRQVTVDQIDPKKIYTLQQLDKNSNSKRYGVKSVNVPGHALRERIEEGYVWDVLSVQPMDIRPNQIYEVSNFFHRPSAELLADERVIDCGNWKSIVFGKALMELVAEQQSLPHIDLETGEYGPYFHKAEARLDLFARGRSSFYVQNATDYTQSLVRLRTEHKRAAEHTGSLDDLIHSAAARTGASGVPSGRNNIIPFQR